MPSRMRATKWWYVMVGAVVALSIAVLAMFVIGYIMQGQLNEARTRLSTLEVNDLAEDAAARTAEVASCYASARGRPRLIVILRLLATTAERDPIAAAAVESFIMDYEASTPKIAECDKRARDNGLRPEDFPPSSNTRGETTR